MNNTSKNQFFIDIFREADDNTAKKGGEKAHKLGLGIHGLSDEEHSKNAKKGGDVSGNNNKESGWASELGKEWGRTNMIEHMNKEVLCEHCAETTNLGNIERWHKDGICKERIQFIEMIVEWYNNGMGIKSISRETDYNTVSIYNMLVKGGAEMRVNQKLNEDDVWNILIQLDNKVSRNDLANMYGVSKPTINAIAQGRNWPKVQEKYRNYKNK
jgi:uncharacterized protein (DUF433 family)